MNSFSATHKALLAGGAVLAFGVAAAISVGARTEFNGSQQETKAGPDDHTMFGGTVSRNMVNLKARDVPEKVEAEGPSLLWKEALGSRAYGGPIIAGGKVFVGT